MILQIAIGTVVMLATIAAGGISLWWVEAGFLKRMDWLTRGSHPLKLLVLLSGTAAWSLGIVTLGVWTWAIVIDLLGLFPTLEASVYFALVSFTTLGYGDVVLADDWRLLGGMMAANGFIIFGILVAGINDLFREVRHLQRRGARAGRAAR